MVQDFDFEEICKTPLLWKEMLITHEDIAQFSLCANFKTAYEAIVVFFDREGRLDFFLNVTQYSRPDYLLWDQITLCQKNEIRAVYRDGSRYHFERQNCGELTVTAYHDKDDCEAVDFQFTILPTETELFQKAEELWRILVLKSLPLVSPAPPTPETIPAV